jgi:hypothetical protein
MDFADLIPASTFTAALGDDVTYHAASGPVGIKAMVSDIIDPVFSNEPHISAKRKQISVALIDVPGLKNGSKFTIDGIKNTVDDIIANDGQFATCVLKK